MGHARLEFGLTLILHSHRSVIPVPLLEFVDVAGGVMRKGQEKTLPFLPDDSESLLLNEDDPPFQRQRLHGFTRHSSISFQPYIPDPF